MNFKNTQIREKPLHFVNTFELFSRAPTERPERNLRTAIARGGSRNEVRGGDCCWQGAAPQGPQWAPLRAPQSSDM